MKLLSKKEINKLKNEQQRQQMREAQSILDLLKRERKELVEFREAKDKEMAEIMERYSVELARLEDQRAKLSSELSKIESDRKAALRVVEKANRVLEELKKDKHG